ncbi:MAG: hypothetical protein ACREIC_27125, partial [Limisphaerales bacterium]
MAEAIDAERELKTCGDSEGFATALSEVRNLKPHVVVFDFSKHTTSAPGWIRKLRALHMKGKILATSERKDARYANRLLAAGADGYILREEEPDAFVLAIRDLLAGAIYVSEHVLSSDPGPQ